MILTVHPVFEFLPETLRVVAATANSAQQKGYLMKWLYGLMFP